jgi:hypothetical protein
MPAAEQRFNNGDLKGPEYFYIKGKNLTTSDFVDQALAFLYLTRIFVQRLGGRTCSQGAAVSPRMSSRLRAAWLSSGGA